MAHPSNSEWLDIDGIIQSFLQDGDSSVLKPSTACNTERWRCDHCRTTLASHHENRGYAVDVAHVSGISRLGEEVNGELQWPLGRREGEREREAPDNLRRRQLSINRRHLPSSTFEWKRHLISALGSRGNDSRQIDGIGGGLSTTSKVAVVASDADIDWTFVQVAVGRESIDMTGTCGNVSSGVGRTRRFTKWSC